MSELLQNLNSFRRVTLYGSGLIMLVSVLFFPVTSQAHQSSISVDSEKSMVMHVEPNHYPVAGRDNRIIFFYDKVKWDVNGDTNVATLRVTDPSGDITESNANFADGSITTNHEFAEDGLYDMELIVARNDTDIVDTFKFSVGTIQETQQQKNRRRARTVQIVGGVSLAGLSLGLLFYYFIRSKNMSK